MQLLFVVLMLAATMCVAAMWGQPSGVTSFEKFLTVVVVLCWVIVFSRNWEKNFRSV
jgi:hypothetical protein